MKIGDPMDPATQVGALISREHCEKVLGYIERGRSEGAAVAAGGGRPDDPALAKGNFVQPTVFAGCRDDMGIVREEIFGPVLSLLSFKDEEEVIARAHATPFGLSAGVFPRARAPGHRAGDKRVVA